MEAFAYISIYEVFSKLAISYIIYIITYDKLIVYAGLIAIRTDNNPTALLSVLQIQIQRNNGCLEDQMGESKEYI